MSGDGARIAIVVASIALGVVEWVVIRKTNLNKWALPVAFWALALAYGAVMGPAPVTLPSLMLAFSILLCAVVDWYRKHWGKRDMSDVDRMRMMDL